MPSWSLVTGAMLAPSASVAITTSTSYTVPGLTTAETTPGGGFHVIFVVGIWWGGGCALFLFIRWDPPATSFIFVVQWEEDVAWPSSHVI